MLVAPPGAQIQFPAHILCGLQLPQTPSVGDSMSSSDLHTAWKPTGIYTYTSRNGKAKGCLNSEDILILLYHAILQKIDCLDCKGMKM